MLYVDNDRQVSQEVIKPKPPISRFSGTLLVRATNFEQKKIETLIPRFVAKISDFTTKYSQRPNLTPNCADVS